MKSSFRYDGLENDGRIGICISNGNAGEAVGDSDNDVSVGDF